MSALMIRAAAAGSAAALALAVAAPAGASDEWGINGTFAVSSNGDWAKINSRYENQPTVRNTWTISMTCTSPTDCAGTVTSDGGWTAPIYTTNGFWYVKRVVPNWRYCEDGSPIDGLQVIKFYPVNQVGMAAISSNEYTGQDKTVGPSGSCGRNQPPVVEMPFYMKKI